MVLISVINQSLNESILVAIAITNTLAYFSYLLSYFSYLPQEAKPICKHTLFGILQISKHNTIWKQYKAALMHT